MLVDLCNAKRQAIIGGRVWSKFIKVQYWLLALLIFLAIIAISYCVANSKYSMLFLIGLLLLFAISYYCANNSMLFLIGAIIAICYFICC